jgi:DNA adenine methylase
MKIPVPFPYQGSKRYLAPQILSYIPPGNQRIIEAFAGSAAVSLAASSSNLSQSFHLNDLNKPLMLLWEEIINTPIQLSSKYKRLWNAQHKDLRFYYQIREKFNIFGRPDHLLYLLSRCVTGSVRYNRNGEFNQSPDNRRYGVSPEEMRQRLISISSLLKGKTIFTSMDYKEFVITANTDDFVYLDPPYQGVCGNRDSRYFQSVDYVEFVSTLEVLNKRGISYLVSYDGRTGRKHYGKKLPEHLNLLHRELRAGRSSQATLLGKSSQKYESLYISPALLDRIKHKDL